MTDVKPSVCLVDDDVDVRNAIRLLLKSEGIACTTFGSAREFLSAVDGPEKPAGCLLLDLRMADTDGLEVLHQLHARKFPMPTVIVTAYANVPVAVAAVKAGALNVIEKPFADAELVAAVRDALAVYEKWRRNLEDRLAAAQRISRLTPREIEVLDLMVRGLPNKDIAVELGISPKTLDIHRSNVMDKMEARTTADLVRARLLDTIDLVALPYLFN